MAAGEAGTMTAELLLPPPPLPLSPPPGGTGTERALEEAAASGTLSLAGRRLRAFPVAAARRWDLSDTTQADLSRNRFGEVPEAACHLVSLEGLSLYHNCLRSVSPAIANLQALAHLDLSRNQLTSLPACLCLLPLRVLNASNNRLAQLPENIGALGALRQLDVSCNELRALPASVGQLKSLRDLNLRRNQLTVLPTELSELPLVRLDFSCNRVVTIPRCYRRLRHLQIILADNNPLQSPPAQVCLKGKVHIFKYLHLEAEAATATRPPPTCLTDELCPLRQRGGLDSGFNSVDSGSKRWSGNESTDEFSELPRQPREKRSGAAAGDSDPEQVDFIEGSLTGEEEEEETLLEEQQGSSPRGDTPEKASCGRVVPVPWRGEGPGEGRRRPESLQVWQERERRQQARRIQGLEQRDSFLRAAAKATPAPAAHTNSQSEPGTFLQRQPRTTPGPDEAPGPPLAPPGSSPRTTPKPTSFLFRSSSSSSFRGAATKPAPPSHDAPPDPDERELIAEMRQSIESLLQLRLPEELGEALSDGELLCRLANRLRPRLVPFIHVPSPAAPKLSTANSRRNVESFLEACRRLGVPEALPPRPPSPRPGGGTAGLSARLGLAGEEGEEEGAGSGVTAIDNKIEQAMDLVKSHLLLAVREEVELLREQIKELSERRAALERENGLLRALATPQQLARLRPPRPHGPPA
ncbi:leucine-rich repeat and calponin homology domain-containing protein 4 isoform X3 [Accipiter gentilis]|uniref:leucine-rich repeat and calponin homology domain-containing protein 4 isoform X3 n=1 Tax=Astur gentilis TaxID=8957 RepID=UPI0021109552|nr:leucine-rich repeat and calponin homology domain-containing protein 4 isoform X3 [Accipiter gentilis]